MGTVPLLTDEEASPEARAVLEAIRISRGTEPNNFWRALAHDPAQMRDLWETIGRVMAPGALDPLVKEMIYVAVSAANGCSYCVHSHTAAARAKGMTPAMHAELLAVVALACRTNALATALGVEIDDRFRA
ncbi:alkylhydroperoxidase AhpD family core domain protein [Rubellimicrobium thermophilum DSM 16684]|uniref:Alkylhydroperoxidase AhpD family core domain protein n=1 Tax=Rubellimicrobium thermophilum DSM 16684 TaxID=1123069 RepID=S9R2X1_9RHOB|nr:carboxymuconolactone decarboxylase family protein [Rubellimicrobium thermophilum]EPX86328.1 alkylhydroperoxidase AhpD family core domain protein [Rubellimicrobium thermophilum DSM 16684]